MEYLRFSCASPPLGLLWYHDLYLSLLSVLSLLWCMVQVGGLVSFFASTSPVLPTPFIEETVFSLCFALASFVKC